MIHVNLLNFVDLTPNGTDTEQLLADAYPVKQNHCNDDDDEVTRVEEGSNNIGKNDMDGMAEQTLTDGEVSDSGDSLEGATLTPTKQQQPANEKGKLVSLMGYES